MGPVKPTRDPRFYFSFRSPYSWLAYRDLMTDCRDVADKLTWMPFWEPDELSLKMLTDAGGAFPYVENSRPKARYVLQDVRRLAEQRGLTLTWPVDRRPCWEVAHLAYLVARRYDQGPQFIARVYRARWELGQNISERATIATVAADLGLDPVELANAADDPDVRREGLAALLSIHVDGVFGVPFFIDGFDKYWGVDRLSLFVDAMRRKRPVTPTGVSVEDGIEPDTAASADQGHAGGCG